MRAQPCVIVRRLLGRTLYLRSRDRVGAHWTTDPARALVIPSTRGARRELAVVAGVVTSGEVEVRRWRDDRDDAA